MSLEPRFILITVIGAVWWTAGGFVSFRSALRNQPDRALVRFFRTLRRDRPLALVGLLVASAIATVLLAALVSAWTSAFRPLAPLALVVLPAVALWLTSGAGLAALLAPAATPSFRSGPRATASRATRPGPRPPSPPPSPP